MPTKSQVYNKDEIYPEEWTDEDKVNFDELFLKAKQLYPKYDEWVMKLAIVAHINMEKGNEVAVKQEDINNLKKQYLEAVKPIYETPREEI
jgi:hypothetical protein